MTALEIELLSLIKDRAFKRGTFQLASGDTSDYYIDGKMIEVHPRAAWLIGEIIYEQTEYLSFTAIGGLAVGAVPLVTAAVISCYNHNRFQMEGFWVANQAKTHGTCKTIEGNLKPQSQVVIVEDVITRGTSTMKAVQAVRDLGCNVVRVLALVDRLQGAGKLLADNGLTYKSVFTVRDLGVEVHATP